jgi:hypothetical protein
MPFTDQPPDPPRTVPRPPPIGTVWVQPNGTLTKEAEKFILETGEANRQQDQFHKALVAYLTAMAAAIP